MRLSFVKRHLAATGQNDQFGQINPEGVVGQTLINIVNTNNFKTILDIGTWNGLGSTKCFLLALQGNSSTRFISIESNKERYLLALKNLEHLVTSKTSILNGSILTENSISEAALYSVFPEFKGDSTFEQWHSMDMENIKSSPYILDRIPSEIDFVLFDGGEFTTFFEFQILFPRCTNIIAMDDVNVSKCRKMREILTASPEWTEIHYIPERNGFSIFKRKV